MKRRAIFHNRNLRYRVKENRVFETQLSVHVYVSRKKTIGCPHYERRNISADDYGIKGLLSQFHNVILNYKV